MILSSLNEKQNVWRNIILQDQVAAGKTKNKKQNKTNKQKNHKDPQAGRTFSGLK